MLSVDSGCWGVVLSGEAWTEKRCSESHLLIEGVSSPKARVKPETWKDSQDLLEEELPARREDKPGKYQHAYPGLLCFPPAAPSSS